MSGGGWMFVWLMFALKIPILALFGIVYWAVKSSDDREPEPVAAPSTGHRPDRPPPRHPRPPRRGGPHAAPRPAPPSRVRARARSVVPR
ncbi:MAG TPA: hypothetical protein VF545_06495 [Thermoleophilaceae bacterium]